MILRDYQHESVRGVEDCWMQGSRAPLVVLPTGTGKTIVFTELARRNEESRTLIVCPMRELIGQAAKKLFQVTGVQPDIEQAHNWANESEWSRNQYVVASKQTLTMARGSKAKRFERFKEVGLVVVDEAHLAITKPYKDMLDWFMDQGAVVVGVTATPNRHDKKSMQNVFDSEAYTMTILDAIQRGWLVTCKSNVVRIQSMNLSEVSIQKGDFAASELNAIVEEEKVELEMADVIARESESLKTLVFCSSVLQAKKLAEILKFRYSLSAEFVCADTKLCSEESRREITDSFVSEGGVQIVINVGCMTTGFDFPALQHIVNARPTRSLSLFTQIFGRGTRPLPGVVDFEGSDSDIRKQSIARSLKPHFKMTDLVDSTLEHKIVTSIDVMAGDVGSELLEAARKAAVDKGQIDPLDLIDETRKQLEQERRIREEQEARRRASVKASTTYETVQSNPFDESLGLRSQAKRKGPVALFGKHKGQPLSTIPTGYLRWLTSDKVKLRPWYERSVKEELKSRGVILETV